MGAVIRRAPQPGPQTAFASTPADVAIYGGAAGGGKSWALLFEAARGSHVPGYAGIIFRRHLTNIVGPGGLFDASRRLYSELGARAKGSPKPEWVFPSGARIGFDHLEHESSAELHQGTEYAFVGFDELTHFSERQFFYLTSRSRSTCGVRPYIRATCNPDPDSFVRKLIDWWIDPMTGFAIPERSGVLRWYVRDGDELVWSDSRDGFGERYSRLDEKGNRLHEPKSFTFIQAKLEDNPALTDADPGYRATLSALPTVDRERLLNGNWDVRPTAGSYFNRGMFEFIDEIDETQVRRRVRGWDKAATKVTPESPNPDWTIGGRVSELKDGSYVIEHAHRMRDTPGEVDASMLSIASGDARRCEIGIWQDPGAAGVADVEHTRKLLKGYTVHSIRASENKVTYANLWQPLAEKRKIKIVRGPWNEPFMRVLEAFPSDKANVKDDDVDAISVCFQVLLRGGYMATLREAMKHKV